MDDLAHVAPRASNTELRSILGLLSFFRRRRFQADRSAFGRRAQSLRAGPDADDAGQFPAAGRADQPPRHAREGRAADRAAGIPGTVVFVSHDRYFIDKLATRVFEVADGGVHIFPGNYEDYLRRKSEWLRPAASGTGRSRNPKSPKRTLAATAPTGATSRRPRKAARQRRQTAQAESHQTAPDEGAAARNRRRDHAARSGDRRLRAGTFQFQSAQQSIDIAEMLESRRTDMKNLMAEWEEVSEILEANR